jgi:ribosomal protein S18 acetylase RimI-like enzyme
MKNSDIVLQKGLPERFLSSAADLYNDAFGPKFSVAIPDEQKRIAVLRASFIKEYAFVALTRDALVGVAGIHTPAGAFTGGLLSGRGAYRYLISQLGVFGATRAAGIFALYERKPAHGELLMDGIAVRTDFRGQGIGSRLLDKLIDHARQNKYERVRLDVIDTNPRARKLYERYGFKAVKTEKYPNLHWLLGFSGTTTMELMIS